MPELQVVGAVACVILTVESVLNAAIAGRQAAFSPRYRWVWWAFVPCWAYYAYRFIAL
jgi:hypothetical protein